MKKSKSILTRHTFLIIALQIIMVVLIALPQLDPYRQQLSEATKIPVDLFWIPFLAILVALSLIAFGRLSTHLVAPTEELVNQTKLGAASIAFHKKSMNFEEDHLKHFIESQALRSADLEVEITRMEAEVERTIELAAFSPDEISALKQQVEKTSEAKAELNAKLTDEQAKVAKQEKELVQLRRQLKQLSREESIDPRSEATEPAPPPPSAAAPISSILVARLKTPLSLINNLAWRLARSWEEISPAKIREGLEEISRNAEEQLELLKTYQAEENSEQNRKAL